VGKEAKKDSEKVAKTPRPRNKAQKAPDQHAGLCTVCKHAGRLEIEARYMDFESVDDLATEFEVTRDAIYRHVRYYGLARKRSSDTEKVLEAIIRKGAETLTLLPSVDMKIVVESVKELHKVRGKHKEPAKNPETAAREAYERLRQDFIDIPDETIRQRVAERYGVQESVLIH